MRTLQGSLARSANPELTALVLGVFERLLLNEFHLWEKMNRRNSFTYFLKFLHISRDFFFTYLQRLLYLQCKISKISKYLILFIFEEIFLRNLFVSEFWACKITRETAPGLVILNLAPAISYLHIELKSMKGQHGRRIQKTPVGGGGKLYQKFRPGRCGLGDGRATPAESQQHRISGCVAVVDCDVVLHLTAFIPNLLGN